MHRFRSLLKAVLCASTLSVLVNVSMAMAEPTDSDYLEKARVLAEKGDADAQLMLGIYKYNQGMHGSDEAAKEAIEWLNKAAAKGNSGAEFYLGAAYNTGTGVEKKPDRAVEWWQKAAKHGNLDAQATLGSMYFNRGDGYLSYLWTCYAAEHGNHNSVQDLRLIETYLTPNQISEARKIVRAWNPQEDIPPHPSFDLPAHEIIMNPSMDKLRKAAEAGNTLAQYELYLQYTSSIGHLPRNEAEGQKWLRKSAEGGNPEAQQVLASSISDPGEKAKWTNKAAAQTKVDAQAYLNQLSLKDTGTDTPKDPAQAIKYWTKSAEEQHDTRAFYNLGLSYYKGLGVEKNDVTAYMWIAIAVAHFDWKSSLEASTNFKEILTPDQVAHGKRLAQEWIEKHRVSADASK
jgi:uncharacterized protein